MENPIIDPNTRSEILTGFSGALQEIIRRKNFIIHYQSYPVMKRRIILKSRHK